MASKKQRRRREKGHRHEYVWEDSEGNELKPEDVPARKAEPGSSARKSSSGREPQAPSWPRTLKRSLIFAPIMFGTVLLLSSNVSRVQQITQTAIIVAIFIPFSYLLDAVFWRTYKKRLARQEASGRRGS